MPPEFDKKLQELNIPHDIRSGGVTVVNTYPPYPGEISDSAELSKLLLELADQTDAKLVSSDGDHLEFGPKK